ncbi:SHOCT domain-containing protein [Pediococcus acidilactici]|uniref:SHOCT domain-containing protein n=1 Tax=Pediococcus acidilactici TaxID=1254 RepID=UPI0013282A9D|nr:SHOCT domain-containing protein [Pediococcus acidilactici]KAF0372790.1 DUF4428 domain-containing protein [Pediococcus acidilactici]KAF0383394.1 DUF4428 domain-containing protein [Pediococcus acidilactici]KAF0457440.1 DUF4428 domain-containing protein [Pediococcus acidilactici]KAF0476481.1 DUF4428 domain-containing protein [Pediococcus acidilactici]KAF0537002.1 DUF4428 domain-containing protein [Pediococcus acidilactici]
MPKKCSICNSEIKLFAPNLKFKDGILDGNCLSKIGLNPDHFMDIKWASEHSITDAKDLMDRNIKIDVKAERAKIKENKKAKKAEQNAEKAKIDEQKERNRNERLNKLANSEGGELNEEVVLNRFQKHNFSKTSKLMADFDDKKLYIKKTFLQMPELVDFDQIISYTPIESGHHISKHHRITRGIVGGLVAGGIGAGLGAATGGKDFDQIDELSIIINFTNGHKRKLTFGKSLKAGSMSAKFSLRDYQESLALLNAIMNIKQQDSEFNDDQLNIDIDQLSKLKNILDEGVITQEEFEAKKKQILNL